MKRFVKRLVRYFENKAVVLMYHRVADLLIDPFEIAVSADHFEQHLQVLKQKFNIISVDDLVNQLNAKSLAANSVCITFDDGYGDNYFNARPLLEKYQCPATFYIASQFIGQQQQFWWDELQYILLNTPQLPRRLAMHINGESIEALLENNGILTKEDWSKHRSWLFCNPPPTQRCELYVKIWSLIKPLPFLELQKALAFLKNWAGIHELIGQEDYPMTMEQLKTISDHHLFEIGVHTGTHPALSRHNKEEQYNEISGSKELLEIHCGKQMQTISYPYGDYNATTLSIVKQKKLRGAFTTKEHIVTKRTDPVCIGRYQVKNWNGQEFEMNLTRWLHRF